MAGNNKESVLADIFHNKALIWKLAKNDFKTRFAASYLGTIWAFIQPIVTVAVYWFVFAFALRADRDSQYPFVIWMMAGLVPWFFFSEALNGGTHSLIEYNYLVKKVVFKISILPMVKVLAQIFVHAFFIVLIIALSAIYGYKPDLYTLQIIYYVICSFIMVLGITYLTSAITVFFRDLMQIINIALQVGIWITPIMWDAQAMIGQSHPVILKILKLNPMYYIVDGFRDALFTKTWFFEKGIWTLYFWAFTIIMFAIGTSIFKKLKVHFADIL